ncbi:hypothetical protein EVAR_81519_1 [Eumeta japonica]|uniref:Uncharacterized protein n=1 Tax=Eumeta variegata TaxID=151549 RepID=A0A4C1W104_EUMVA|nr:hypothetical protein EVAR_81519_1 [Eumeta japonica]
MVKNKSETCKRCTHATESIKRSPAPRERISHPLPCARPPKSTKAFKSEGYEPTPPLRNPITLSRLTTGIKLSTLLTASSNNAPTYHPHATPNTYTGLRRKFDRKSPSIRRTI